MSLVRFLNIFPQLLVISICISCGQKKEEIGKQLMRIAPYTVHDLQVDSTIFHKGEIVGYVENKSIDEASGLAASRSMPGVLFTHNDSGDHNRLFLVYADNASDKGSFRLLSASNRDWEDMCIGKGPNPNIDYLYVGDIGDNQARYPCVFIYRFPEPSFDLSGGLVQNENVGPEQVECFPVVYEDGPRDAETLMIDPIGNLLFIISKREDRSMVYQIDLSSMQNNDTLKPRKVLQLPFNWATAGDISADGTEILIKTLDRIYYWQRSTNESVVDALMRKPKRINYTIEEQGEAVAWNEDDSGFYTLSEAKFNNPVPLFFYSKR